MTPFYFGASAAPLYGVYHEPAGGAFAETAVLLCSPVGHEAMRAHRAFKRLAERLAERGLPTLRFDYRGTGDSAGETGSGRPALWKEDLETACEELLALSGADAVSVVGLRLGALLALDAFAGVPEVRTRILWDPPPTGDAFLADCLSLERIRLERIAAWAGRQPDPPPDGPWTILGFPFPPTTLGEIRTLPAPDVETLRDPSVHVVVSHPDYRAALPRGRDGAVECVPDGGDWTRFEKAGGALLVDPILRRIESLLAGEE